MVRPSAAGVLAVRVSVSDSTERSYPRLSIRVMFSPALVGWTNRGASSADDAVLGTVGGSAGGDESRERGSGWRLVEWSGGAWNGVRQSVKEDNHGVLWASFD